MTLFSNKIEEYLQRWPAMYCIHTSINSVYQSSRQLEHQTTPARPASQLGWLARSSCEPEMSTRSIEIRDRSRNIAWTIIVHHKEKTLKMTIANLRHFTEKLIGQKPWVGISSRRFCTAMSTDLSIWPAPVFGILRRCSSIMISNLSFCCAHVVISLNFESCCFESCDQLWLVTYTTEWYGLGEKSLCRLYQDWC